MFKSSIVVPTWILIACGISACTVTAGNETAQGGSAGAAGSESQEDTGGRAAKGGSTSTAGATSSRGGQVGIAGAAGGSGVSCVKRGPITTSTVWEPLEGCPDGFEVPNYVVVKGTGTTLTIKPGVKMTFASGGGLEVWEGAALVAVGSSTNPITFTGWQKVAGSWKGISFFSNALDNEIGNAIIEYSGQKDGVTGAIVLSSDVEYARLKLWNTEIRNNGKFGLSIYAGVTLARFEDNVITQNASGAARVDARSAHQLNGTGNRFVDNGDGNIVRLEAGSPSEALTADVTWPNVSPAVYRVTAKDGTSGGQVFVQRHLTLQAGSVFEFVGGSGFDIRDGSSGLSAVGTSDAPIVLRGVDDSLWMGIGFCESSWTGNALEEVRIENAGGKTYSASFCAGNATAGVTIGHIDPASPSKVRIKNVKFVGPNNAPTDIVVRKPSTLTQDGTNSGSGQSGTLSIYTY